MDSEILCCEFLKKMSRSLEKNSDKGVGFRPVRIVEGSVPDFILQAFTHEMEHLFDRKLKPIKKRLDRVEERSHRARTQREQIYPNERTEMRSSRRRTFDEYVKRDLYPDSYSSRNLGRNKSSYEFEAYQGNERESTSHSSYASKYSSTEKSLRRSECVSYKNSSMEVYSRRVDRDSYEDSSTSFQRKVYCSDSFVLSPFCNKVERRKRVTREKKNRKRNKN